MTRFTHILTNAAVMTALVLGTYALTSTAFAAPPDTASKNTAAELLAKADHHEMMAANYRARMQADPKHAIVYFTQANHCDKEAQAFRTAALQAEGSPTYRR